MSKDNLISIEVSETALNNIMVAIDMIKANLPNLVALSKEERRELPKMGDKTIAFVQKCLEYAEQNQALVPSFMNVPEMSKDINAATDLLKIMYPLRQLVERLDD